MNYEIKRIFEKLRVPSTQSAFKTGLDTSSLLITIGLKRTLELVKKDKRKFRRSKRYKRMNK